MKFLGSLVQNICIEYSCKKRNMCLYSSEWPSANRMFQRMHYENMLGHQHRLVLSCVLSHSLSVQIARRYGHLRGLTSSSCGGLWPSTEAFLAVWAKKELFTLFVHILDHFWCSVVTCVMFFSNLNNFENSAKISKNPKESKESKNL